MTLRTLDGKTHMQRPGGDLSELFVMTEELPVEEIVWTSSGFSPCANDVPPELPTWVLWIMVSVVVLVIVGIIVANLVGASARLRG